jgi:hypothetical protein
LTSKVVVFHRCYVIHITPTYSTPLKSRVAGLCALLSLRSWIAPCSGAWLSPLRTDCSALCFVHPALTADLTRHSSLYAPPRLRIAPLPALCAVPLTDCSVFDTSEPRAAFGLLRLRHLMHHAVLRFLFARRLVSRTLTRIAPLRVLDASVQVYGSRRTQTLHAPAARMDFSVLAAFAPRHHRLLCIRHLMLPGLMDISTIPFRIPR